MKLPRISTCLITSQLLRNSLLAFFGLIEDWLTSKCPGVRLKARVEKSRDWLEMSLLNLGWGRQDGVCGQVKGIFEEAGLEGVEDRVVRVPYGKTNRDERLRAVSAEA
jgi:hypothetical protein